VRPYPLPRIYRVVDVGKPGQPHLEPKQQVWIARILRTPYYEHRVPSLRYLNYALSPIGPPLAVFVQSGENGSLIVDHVASNWPCNPWYFEGGFVAATPGCDRDALPSPVR